MRPSPAAAAARCCQSIPSTAFFAASSTLARSRQQPGALRGVKVAGARDSPPQVHRVLFPIAVGVLLLAGTSGVAA